MSLEEKLDEAIRDAMKGRRADELACLRMIKSLVAEKRTAPGFTGGVNDELVLGVMASYSKKLAKTIDEVEKAGRGDNPVLESYRFEIELLKNWLPEKMDEAATRKLVRETLVETGLSGPAAAGRLMGLLMKSHRDQLDAALVKRIVGEELAVG